MRALFLIVAILFSLTATSYAADTAPAPMAAPQELQGRWDFPRCMFSQLFFTVSKHFTMRADQNAAFFERLVSAKKDGNHFMVQDNKKDYALQIGPGVNGSTAQLNLYYMTDSSPEAIKKYKKNPTDANNAQLLEYSKCPDDEMPEWTTLLGTKMNILPLLDTVYEACGDKVIMGNAPCQQSIFDQFDQDHDGSLNYHELLETYPRLAFIVAGNSCNFRITFNPAKVDNSAVLFASEALSFLDQDKSGSVSFEEARNINAISQTSFTHGFMQEVKTLYTLLPFLPEATAHYTCLSCGTVPSNGSNATGGGCNACGGGK